MGVPVISPAPTFPSMSTDRFQTFARVMFALGMIGIGSIGLAFDDFAMNWQPVPASLPGHAFIAYLVAAIEVVFGIGLLVRRTAAPASRVLCVFVALWLLSLEVPRALAAPLTEARWLAVGETAITVAGAWMLFAGLNPGSRLSAPTKRIAPYVFGLALLPVGLSHFFYIEATVDLVPSYMPFRMGWAYFCGAAHIAAGLAVLFRVVPRLAATMEAGMITIFTLLVAFPPVMADPTKHFNWAAAFSSFLIGNGAWCVAAYMAAAHASDIGLGSSSRVE
jgi:uncharacterized membrane protein